MMAVRPQELQETIFMDGGCLSMMAPSGTYHFAAHARGSGLRRSNDGGRTWAHGI